MNDASHPAGAPAGDAAPQPEPGKALSPIAQARAEWTRLVPEIAKALPSHVPPERFERVVFTAIQMNSDLMEADRQSLWAACVKAAQDGLMPDGREGVLVTFYDRRRGKLLAQWQPMVAGILKKVRNSGEVSTISANVVYEGETFSVILGDEERIEHRRDLNLVGRADPIAVYAIATLKDGAKIREVMTWDQVGDVRAVSRAPEKGPWATWTEEMAKKTVIRRLAKRLPMSTDRDEELARVIERVDEQYEFSDRRRGAAAPRRIEGDAIATAPEGDPNGPPDDHSPVCLYVAASGQIHPSPDVAAWRADWLRRIAAASRAGQRDELRDAWARNKSAIAEVERVAPLTAKEVVEALAAALMQEPAKPAEPDLAASLPGGAAPAEAAPAKPAEPEPDPLYVPLTTNERGGKAWKPWSDQMRVMLAACANPAEVKALNDANAEALGLMAKHYPESFTSWSDACVDRLGKVAEPDPPEPVVE